MVSMETFGHFLLPLTMNKGEIDTKLAERVCTLRLQYLHQMKTNRPERHAIRNLLAMLEFRLGQFDKALEYLDKILSDNEDPDNLNAIANRKYMCEKLFRVQEARECDQRISNFLSQNGTEESGMRCRRLRARSLAEQAFAYSFERFEESVIFDRYRKSIELYQQATDLAGDLIDKVEKDDWKFVTGVASFIIYKRINHASHSEETESRFQQAVNSFVEIVQECEDNNMVSDSWRHLGVLFKQCTDRKHTSFLPSIPDNFKEYVSQPGKCFEKAQAASPNDPRILARHAEYCKSTGDEARALELVNKSIQLDKTDYNLHAYNVRACILIERYKEQLNKVQFPDRTLLEEAEKDLTVTIQTSITPWHLAAMADVFYLKALDRHGLVKQGSEDRHNLQVALTFCAKAAACDEGLKRPEIDKQRGECLCAMGEHQTSLGCFKRAVDCEISNQFYKGSIGLLVTEYEHVLRPTVSTLSDNSPLLADMVYWLHKAASACLSNDWTLTQLKHLKQLPCFWKTFATFCDNNGHRTKLESIELAAGVRTRQPETCRQQSLITPKEGTSIVTAINRQCARFTVVASFVDMEASGTNGTPTSDQIQTDKIIDVKSIAETVSAVRLDGDSEGDEQTVHLIYNLKTGKIHIPAKSSRDITTKDLITRKHVRQAPEKPFNKHLPNDFFVIYSASATEWVQHCLLEELEGNRLKGCIRDRDFILGKPKLDNYLDCISNSVCTIIVITKDFEKEQGCIRGMLMAMELYKPVIPVLREARDVPGLLKPYTSLDATDGAVDWARLEKNIEQQINVHMA